MTHTARKSSSLPVLQSLEGELICGVCLELFDRPVILPCGHNFCYKCVASIIDNGSDTLTFSFLSVGPPNSFNCPVCQKNINLRKNGLDELPLNKVVDSIVFLYKNHSPTDIFDHAWNMDLRGSITQCTEHKMPQERYCDSCSVLVCKECEKIGHHGEKARHKVDSTLDTAIELQSQIASLLADVKKKDIQLIDRIQLLEDLVSGIDTNEEQVTTQLDHHINSIMTTVRQQREELKRSLTNEINGLRVPISEELKKCKAVKTNIQELMRKLGNIQRTRNMGLKIKLMKDSRIHLDKLLCYEIPWCVENQEIPEVSLPGWELSTLAVTKEIGHLAWKHKDTEMKESQSELTQTDMDSMVAQTHDTSHFSSAKTSEKVQEVKVKVIANGAEGGLAVSHSEEKTFDELDGDVPVLADKDRKSASDNRQMPQIVVVTPDQIRSEVNCQSHLPETGNEIEQAATQLKQTSSILKPDCVVTDTRRDSPLVVNAESLPVTKGDMSSSEVAEKFKKRGERKTLHAGSPTKTFDSEKKKEKTKKERKEKSPKKASRELFTDIETSPTTTSQALASFVARRRTMSPASSVSKNLGALSDSKDITDGRRREDSMRTSVSDTKLLTQEQGQVVVDAEILSKGTKPTDTSRSETKLSRTRKSCPVGQVPLSNSSHPSSGHRSDLADESKDTSPKSFSKQPISVSLDFDTDTEVRPKTRAKSQETVI